MLTTLFEYLKKIIIITFKLELKSRILERLPKTHEGERGKGENRDKGRTF